MYSLDSPTTGAPITAVGVKRKRSSHADTKVFGTFKDTAGLKDSRNNAQALGYMVQNPTYLFTQMSSSHDTHLFSNDMSAHTFQSQGMPAPDVSMQSHQGGSNELCKPDTYQMRSSPALFPGFGVLPSSQAFSDSCVDLQPCNNPACEDVQPCTANLDPCSDPQQCLGNICYDSNCAPEDDGVDFACDQDCESSTKCAAPCYGDECDVPACEAPCPSTLVSTTGQREIKHQQIGQQILCQGPGCNIPGTECVNPQCLSLDYVPAVHFHHALDDFQKYGEEWRFDNELMQSGCTDTTACHNQHLSADFTYQHPVASSIRDADRVSLPIVSSHSLQPLLDWNKANFSSRNTETSTDTEPYALELSDSLSATPSTTAFRHLRNVDFSSPVIRQRNVCLWMVGSGGSERPCGIVFESPSELHAHLEKSHIETLQRDLSVSHQEGYYCRWLGCSRNAASGKPAAFAARPKLKRHAQTHTLHKPFTCPTCGVAMKTKDAMEKHARTHSGERPYACSVDGCNKVFATSTELKTHMVVHSGRKPHECPICGEGFADSSNLSKHKKTHFVGMYRCPHPNCGVRMKRWDQMRRHILSQGHAIGLLEDPEQQKEYKDQMEREWREVPEEQKLLSAARDS